MSKEYENKTKKRTPGSARTNADGQRIQKVLATEGVASRRAIEEMILEGRILVNGRAVAKLPCFVNLAEDDVRVDGRKIKPKRAGGKKVYYLLNKPRGVVCTQNDPQGRPRTIDLIPKSDERLYPIGRLDAETTGLIILTNDGDLTEYLTHPSHGVMKTYVAEIEGAIEGEKIEKLKKGVYLDGKRIKGAGIKVLARNPNRSLVEVRISEGRNREIRRIMARIGYNVKKLKRTAIGPIKDRGLKIGSFRHLKTTEIQRLQRCGRESSEEQGNRKQATGNRND